MMMVAMLSVGFVSCGGDDDDGFPNWPEDEPGVPPSGGGGGGIPSQPHNFNAVNADGVTIYYKFTDNNTAVEVWRDTGLTASYRGKVVIPSTVTHNGETYAVTAIGEWAFSNCSDLTEITIPNSVTSIGNSAFQYCSQFEYITIEDGETTLSMGENEYISLMGGGGYNVFVNRLFIDCPIKTLYLGRNCSYSESFPPFAGAPVKELTIGNSVTEIGAGAFAGFAGLESVTIPNSVTKIGAGAFAGCESLSTLYSLNTTPPKVGYESFPYPYNFLVFVPQEALEAYRKAEGWSLFWNLFGFDPTELKLR